MKSRSKTCIFIGYPKGTRAFIYLCFFYSPKDNKVFVSINVIFLKKDYMKNYKSKSNIIIEEIIIATSISIAPNVDAYVMDKIQLYKRTNIDTPIPRVVLHQQSPNIGAAPVATILVPKQVLLVGNSLG